MTDHANSQALGEIIMIAYLDTIDSPAGPFRFAVDASGALLRAQFLHGDYQRSIEEELEQDGYHTDRNEACTENVRRQLEEYTAGTRHSFDLPLVLTGSDWQRTIWQALTSIPFGETRTYAQLGSVAGRTKSARAAGRATATNRIPLVIPCHRVVGADGSLTGFAGGMELKRRLLAHESAVLGRITGFAGSTQLGLALPS